MESEKIFLVEEDSKRRQSRKLCLLLVIIFVVIVVCAALFVIGLAISFGLRNGDVKGSGTFKQAAVAADAALCSTAGKDILIKGGSAVDAAIASLLCVGVVNLHSTSIGGGGFMIIYNATTKEAHAIDFREKAPMNASMYMYNDTAQNASTYGMLVKKILIDVQKASKSFFPMFISN